MSEETDAPKITQYRISLSVDVWVGAEATYGRTAKRHEIELRVADEAAADALFYDAVRLLTRKDSA